MDALDTRKRVFLLRIMIEKARRRRKNMQNVFHYVLNRRQLIKLCLVTLLLLISQKNAATPIHVRSCHRLKRNLGWFNHVWNSYSDDRFKKTFRVSHQTFMFILDRIGHILQRKTNEEPVSPECRLAVTLYHLSRGDYYYTIAEMTGLGVSTVCNCQQGNQGNSRQLVG